MTDIAHLGFAVDSSSAVKATSDLDRLGDQAAVTEKQVVGSARKSQTAMKTMAAPLRGAARDAASYSRAAQGASMQTANLAAQWNDIAVMMAAGQNPMQLALQQGTQVSQVLNQMGGGVGALRAIGAGFVSMINPISLATIGIIAGGAALGQWAMQALGASDEAKKLADRMQEVREYSEVLNMELRAAQFGVSQEELTLLDAMVEKQREIATLRDRATPGPGGEIYRRDLRFAEDELVVLQEQFRTMQDQRAELDRIEKAGQDAADAIQKIYGASTRTLEEMQAVEQITRLMKDGLDASAISALQLADVDMASPISAAAQQAAILASNLGISLAAAINLRSLQSSKQYSGRGGDPRQFMDGGTGSATQYMRDLNYEDVGSIIKGMTAKAGRSGGGRSTVDAMAQEAERWIRRAETALQRYNRELADLNELQEMGYLSAEQFAAAQAMLTEEFQQAEFGPVISQIESFSDAIADAIVNGENLGEAMGQVFKQIARDLISSGIKSLIMDTFRFSGRKSSGGGFLGSLFGGLFGGYQGLFAEGGTLGAGQWGIAGENGPEPVVGPARIISNKDYMAGAGMAQSVSMTINVEGANGDQHVMDLVSQGVQRGMNQVRNEVPTIMQDWQKRNG